MIFIDNFIDKKTCIIIVACLLVGGIFSYFVFGSNTNSTGAGDKVITEQLNQVLANQRNLTTQLDGLSKNVAASQRRVETISNRISNAEAGVGQATEKLRSSDSLIEELRGLNSQDQRTLRDILKRNEQQSK